MIGSMNYRCCWFVAQAASLVWTGCFGSVSLAQSPATPGVRPPVTRQVAEGVARPAPEALRVQKLDPELLQILQLWERESAKIKVLQGQHYRQEFNNVFSVEKRSKGAFFYQAPDKGRFDINSVPIKPGQVSNKIDPATMQPYQLAAGTDQSWICTGNVVLQVNPVAKEFEVFPIPPEMQGENIAQSPLPFLFGMKAEEAQRRYELKLFGETGVAYVIDAKPLLQMDAQNYCHARIYLDKKTFVPTSVMLLDPPRTLMTQYTFVEMEVNPQPSLIAKILPVFKDADPFKPDLSTYKRVLPPQVQPASNEVPSNGRSANAVPNGFPQQSNRVPMPR